MPRVLYLRVQTINISLSYENEVTDESS